MHANLVTPVGHGPSPQPRRVENEFHHVWYKKPCLVYLFF